MKFEHTTLQRTIDDLRYYLPKGLVAFYLGAGVDKLLTRDAKFKDTPDWNKLLFLINFPSDKREYAEVIYSNKKNKVSKQWREIIKSWPAEMATQPRWKYGEKSFTKEISDFYSDDKFVPKTEEVMDHKGSVLHAELTPTYYLCKLLSYSNIIITTNYADYITKALRAVNDKISYVVLDREDLPGFIFPQPTEKANLTISYIVHLHGRPSSRSFPILDAWGYNLAQFDTSSYSNTLESVFKSRHIVTIGSSWTDIPLRNILNSINRKYPYLGHSNLAIIHEKLPKNPEQLKPIKAWKDSMSAIYGTTFCFVNDSKQKNLFENLTTSIHFPDINNLEQIADFLDSTGDYESQLQQLWFSEIGISKNESGKTLEKIEIGVDLLREKLIELIQSNNIKNWIIAARIERHLRHQIYLYTKEGLSSEKIRFETWQLLYQNYLSLNVQQKIRDEQLLFDFLTGVYELANSRITNLPKFKNDILYKRLLLCDQVWKQHEIKESITAIFQDIDSMENLSIQLLECGWESISSKVLSDKIFYTVQALPKMEIIYKDKENIPIKYSDILSDSIRIEGIAKLSGCFRRRIKVDVLNTFWNKNPTTTRTRLLGQLNAGYYGLETARIEPRLQCAIGVGLIVNQLRFEEIGFKRKSTIQVARDTLEDAGIDVKNTLELKNLEYWQKVIPKELNDVYYELINPMRQS